MLGFIIPIMVFVISAFTCANARRFLRFLYLGNVKEVESMGDNGVLTVLWVSLFLLVISFVWLAIRIDLAFTGIGW